MHIYKLCPLMRSLSHGQPKSGASKNVYALCHKFYLFCPLEFSFPLVVSFCKYIFVSDSPVGSAGSIRDSVQSTVYQDRNMSRTKPRTITARQTQKSFTGEKKVQLPTECLTDGDLKMW